MLEMKMYNMKLDVHFNIKILLKIIIKKKLCCSFWNLSAACKLFPPIYKRLIKHTHTLSLWPVHLVCAADLRSVSSCVSVMCERAAPLCGC